MILNKIKGLVHLPILGIDAKTIIHCRHLLGYAIRLNSHILQFNHKAFIPLFFFLPVPAILRLIRSSILMSGNFFATGEGMVRMLKKYLIASGACVSSCGSVAT